MSDLTRVTERNYVPQTDYEKMLRFVGYLYDQYTRRDGARWVEAIPDSNLERLARQASKSI